MRRSAVLLYRILGYKIDSQQRIDCRMEPHLYQLYVPQMSDKKAWPMYMTICNILSRTRNKPWTHATVVLALLPVPPKILDVLARDAQQRQVNKEILYDLMEAIFGPMAIRGTPDLRWNAPWKAPIEFSTSLSLDCRLLRQVTLHGIY